MFHKKWLSLALALVCLAGLGMEATAAEVASDSIYCFSAGDFSAQKLSGICVTGLPDSSAGTILLGQRVVRTGDILSADQLAQLTFQPLRTETDTDVTVTYLPIYENKVDKESTMTICIRGKEDKAPVAEDMALETYKNLPNSAKLKVFDPEGEAMTFAITRQPRRGTVTIAEDGTFTYTPKKNKVGVDSFVYTATDPAGKVSREATVTVTILKPSDCPQYQDTIGKDCRFAAEWMKNSGIFVGETLAGDPCFSPEKNVTRGEFVTMLVKALDVPTDEQLTYSGYTDEIPTWLQPYLAAAVRSGLTEGLSDQQTFHANAAITGADAAAMIENALDRAAVISVEADAALTREQVSQILYQCVQNLNQTNFDTLV